MQQSEARFKEALLHSRDILYRQNIDSHTYDYISDAVTDITGYTPQEVTAMGLDGVRKLILPDDLERLKGHRERLLDRRAHRDASHKTEYRMKCKDGNIQ